MSKPLHILHLEDSELDAELVRHALQVSSLQCQINWVDNFAAYRQALEEQSYDLILADYSLPDCDGMKAFYAANSSAPDTPFILVTGALGEELTIDTLKTGVTDYVLKTNLIRLQPAVLRAIEGARNNREKQQAMVALRLSEERFDLAVRGSGAGIWDWGDVANEQMWWSPRIYELLGYADGEIPATRHQLYELTYPADIEMATVAIAEHFSEKKPYDIELRLRHKDGHHVWFRSRGQAIFDSAGKPQRMAGYVQDISDRKRVQKNLLAREKDLLRAQEVANIGCWSLDIDGGQLFWTSVVYRIFGYTVDSFDGTVAASLERVHPDDLALVQDAWDEALSNGRCDYEHRLLVEGKVRWVREVAEIEYDRDRRPVRAIGVVHDLTEQRAAEEEQRKTDEKYRTITASVQDAIVMINAAGLVTFWNPAAERIFGYCQAEVLNRDIHQLLTPEMLRPKAMAGMKAFSSTGKGPLLEQALEVTGLDFEGREIPLEMSLSAVWQDGQWQAIGVLRDISERKEAESERLALEHQLLQTQKMEAIGTLAGGIAHDFNNILASILGYTSLAEQRMLEGSRSKSDLREVLKAADRAKQLVRQILTFSRKSELEMEPVALDLIIKEVLQLIRASLPATIEVETELQAEGEAILGDATQVHQLLMNLCTNAYHAMPEGGTLRLALHKTTLAEDNPWGLEGGHYLELLVADSGCGIDPEIIDKIFDPYFTTKDVDTGTGLGLSVVRGIVTTLHGFIGVKSTPAEGTCFRLLFPCYQAGFNVEKAALPAVVPGGSERILLVDDEISLARLGKEFLEEFGYQVTAQTSSLAALQLVQAEPDKYDLVITDQTMPRMTGIELAKQLRQVAPELPVILCSGLQYSLETEGVAETSICKVLLKTELIDCLPQLLREVFDQ